MKVQEFLYQIRRLAGDKDADSLSTDMLLTYLTEEMGVVASLFPRQESFEEEISTNALAGNEQDWVDPQFVYLDNTLCNRMYATEVMRMLEIGTMDNTKIFWALINNRLNLSVDTGTVRVVGNWKPDEYLRAHLSFTMLEGLDLDFDAKRVPSLVGRRLSAVRYRMLARCAEELGSFDRAQYFLAMGDRTERDLRNSLNFESTVDMGFMHGCDF